MRVALVNARVLAEGAFVEGLAVVIADGRIEAVVPEGEAPSGVERRDLGGHFLMPGFIDTQVNGGGGVLFNDNPNPEGIAAIGAAHRAFGTTGFLPTLISDDVETMRAGMDAVRSAMRNGVPGVLGIHVEGPFLNLGRKGIHSSEWIRPIDAQAVALLTADLPGCTMVTVAPENVPAASLAALVEGGVIVSAGHSEASWESTLAALDNGLRGFTHLFNAMTPLQSRAPGMVGAALDDGRGWCGIIVDGHHVHPAVLRIALRAADRRRFMLVTDAMPSVGAAAKDFVLQGRRITVRDGVCLDENGTLAGSDLDMAGAVRNAMDLLGLSLAEAAELAGRNPAEFLGLGHELGRIAPGYRADLVLATERVEIVETWISGAPIAA